MQTSEKGKLKESINVTGEIHCLVHSKFSKLWLLIIWTFYKSVRRSNHKNLTIVQKQKSAVSRALYFFANLKKKVLYSYVEEHPLFLSLWEL